MAAASAVRWAGDFNALAHENAATEDGCFAWVGGDGELEGDDTSGIGDDDIGDRAGGENGPGDRVVNLVLAEGGEDAIELVELLEAGEGATGPARADGLVALGSLYR